MLAGLIGPVAAEYSVILAAAVFGGIVGLSMRTPALPGIIQPVRHVATGIGLALLVTPLGAVVAIGMLPVAWSITTDLVLPVVSVGVGMWWHPMLTKFLPALLQRKYGGGVP